MAITTYKRACGYKVGSLKPTVYFLPKSDVKLKYEANNEVVEVKNTSSANNVAKIEALQASYTQNTSYNDRFAFENSLEIILDEQLNESFLEGLRNLRKNDYYIVIENREGTQFLINCELYTTLSYEYNFTDDEDSENNCVVTFTNLSNHPLLLMKNKVRANSVWISHSCSYINGKVTKLLVSEYDKLYSSNNGIMVGELFFSGEALYPIDYLPLTFSLNESYDGKEFTETMSFSIPLDDYKHYWHYNLIEFQNNRYKAMVFTNNGNMMLVGDQYGLFPSYEISTSEDFDTLDTITITMKSVSQYGMLTSIWSTDGQNPDNVFYLYRDVPTDECGCNGYDWCEVLKKQRSADYGQSWTDVFPLQYSYGKILEARSEKCNYSARQTRWVESDEIDCLADDSKDINYRFVKDDGYLCNGVSKYEKMSFQMRDNKSDWRTLYSVYGAFISDNSTECGYVGDDKDKEYVDYKATVNEVDSLCIGNDKYSTYSLYGTVDNSNWELIKLIPRTLIERNSYDCGYTAIQWDCSSVISYKLVDADTFDASEFEQEFEGDDDGLKFDDEQNKGFVEIPYDPTEIASRIPVGSLYCNTDTEYTNTFYLTNNGVAKELLSGEPIDVILSGHVSFEGGGNSYISQYITSIESFPLTNNVTDMSYMFSRLWRLTSLNLNNLNVSNVTSMKNMFQNCSNLEHIDIRRWDTSNVTNMEDMFGSCNKLASIDLSYLNTSKVTNMSWMFANCEELTSIDLSKLDITNVTNMSYMFTWCTKLAWIDISGWDTLKNHGAGSMFNACSALRYIRCKQSMKDYLLSSNLLPSQMKNNGSWEIVG